MVAQTHSLASGARPAPQVFFPPPVPFVGTTKLYRTGGLTGGGNLTHCQLVPADAPFTGGAITLYNIQATPIVIDAVCVAASATANDGFTPIDGSGAAVTWTVVPGGPWVIPAGGFIAPGVLGFKPAAVKVPFALASIPRTDISGAPPLLMFRVHVASGQLNAATPTPSQLAAQSVAYSARRPWNGFYKIGNFVSSNQAGIGTPTQQFVAALSVDFYHSVKTFTAMVCGDSTEQGAKSQQAVNGTATLHDYDGAIMHACDALSTLARPVYAANCGYQGQTVDTFTNSADSWINAIRPNMVLIAPWSINDGIANQAQADTAFLKARAVLLKAKRSGIIAAWRTAIPSSSTSASTDLYRVAVNNRCRTDPDLPCCDYDAQLTNGASPARLQATYDSGDGTHPLEAGYIQISTGALQPFISSYLGS